MCDRFPLSTTTASKLSFSLPNLTEGQTRTLLSAFIVLEFMNQDDLGLASRPESFALMSIPFDRHTTTRHFFEVKEAARRASGLLLNS